MDATATTPTMTTATASVVDDEDDGDGGKNSPPRAASSSSSAAEELDDVAVDDQDDDQDEEDEDDDERASLLSTIPSNRASLERRRRRRAGGGDEGGGGAAPSSSSFFDSILSPLRRRASSERPFLLALALSLTLGTFWIVDTLKDPTFAVLVDGDLERRQPVAKMVSVFGTLCVVAAVEYVDFARRRRRRTLRRRREEREARRGVVTTEEDADAILSGGGRWTKMRVGSSPDDDDDDDGGGGGGGRISVSAFRAVGLSYALAFGIMGYALSRHPSFSSSSSSASSDPPSSPSSSSSLGWRSLAYLLYVTIESYGSIAVATFWSYANTSLSLTAAERHYGSIIAAAQLGAIGGSTIAAEGSRKLSKVPKLFGVSTGGALCVAAVMGWYGRRFPRPMAEEEEEEEEEDADDGEGARGKIGGGRGVDSRLRDARRRRRRRPGGRRRRRTRGPASDGIADGDDGGGGGENAFLSGVYLIWRHNYLLLILGVSCLYEVSLTCLDYEMKLIGLDRFPDVDVVDDGDDGDGGGWAAAATGGAAVGTAPTTPPSSFLGMTTFARFMGRYGQITNGLSLLLSYVAFPLLLERKGLRITLRIFPTLLLIATFFAYLALPSNLPVLFLSMSLLKAVSYSINDPAKEILYIPTSDEAKFKSKFWIDVVGARIAKAIGAGVNARAGSKERIARYATMPSVLAAIALWFVCRKAGERFERLVSTGEIVGDEDEEEEGRDEEIYELDGRRMGGAGRYDLLDGEVGGAEMGADDDKGDETDGWFSDTTIELVRHG